MSYTILVYDDHADQSQNLAKVIREKTGCSTIMADTAEYGIRWLKSLSQPQPDMVLIDLQHTGEQAIEIIRQAKAHKPQLPIVVITPYGNESLATPALNAGAIDFLCKPFSMERLKLCVHNALKQQYMSSVIARLERKHSGHVHFSDLIGKDDSFKKALNLAEQAASSRENVWIDGEYGTGRETLARAIHGSGAGAGKPFVVVNCETIAPESAEVLLFGKEQIAGVSRARLGKLEEAQGGTLFLTEITGLSLHLQQRLFDTLRSCELRRNGAHQSMPLNVRIMCSNSKPLEHTLRTGGFNEALLAKLKGIEIQMPPLRDRKSDVVALAEHFLKTQSAKENKFSHGLSADAAALLESHNWAGNLNQLANLMARVALLTHQDQVDAGTIRLVQQLEPVNYPVPAQYTGEATASNFIDVSGKVKKLRSIEMEAIQLAIRHSGGCMTKAAKTLGIGRSTLYRKVEEMENASSNAARKPDYATDDAGFGW